MKGYTRDIVRGAGQLLLAALALAALRHLVLWEPVLTAPARVVRELARQPAIEEWPASRALAAIQRGTHQPVDLRRDAGLPFIGGEIAWQLPLPHSLTIFARYKEAARAATRTLVFVVDPGERDAGLRVARALCLELDRRAAVLVVGGL